MKKILGYIDLGQQAGATLQTGLHLLSDCITISAADATFLGRHSWVLHVVLCLM